MVRQSNSAGICTTNDPDASTLPSWYETLRRNESSRFKSFSETLPLQEWATNHATEHAVVSVAYDKHDDADTLQDFTVSDKDQMVVTTGGDRVGMVSSRYNLVQNERIFTTLAEAIEELNLHSNVFGEVRDYGSTVSLDLFVDHPTMQFSSDDDDDDDPSMFGGIEVRTSHDGTCSIRARPLLYDSESEVFMRAFSGWRDAQHVKSEDEASKQMDTPMFQMFFESLLEAGYELDELISSIRRSSAHSIDFSQYDFTLKQFYNEWLPQPPQKVVDVAAGTALYRDGITSSPTMEPSNDETISVWALVTGGAYALTHASTRSDGNHRDRAFEALNSALSSPESFVTNRMAVFEKTLNTSSNELSEYEKAAITSSNLSSLSD